MPYFRYCDVIYGDMTTALESKLQRAQNSCVRFISRIKKFDHISESYEELTMPRLEQIRMVSHLLQGILQVFQIKDKIQGLGGAPA